VVLGGVASCSPFAQAMCGRQNPFPAAGWNVSLGHGSHAAAFSAAEKCPATQAVHAAPLMNVPGLQVPQYPSDAPPQPWRPPAAQASAAHSMHSERPVAFWKVPVGQLSQTPPLAKVPVSHFVQYACPLAGCTEPAGHCAHVAAFFSVEIVWAAQSSHLAAIAFADVPGLQALQ
jgi:hypothetical protein